MVARMAWRVYCLKLEAAEVKEVPVIKEICWRLILELHFSRDKFPPPVRDRPVPHETVRQRQEPAMAFSALNRYVKGHLGKDPIAGRVIGVTLGIDHQVNRMALSYLSQRLDPATGVDQCAHVIPDQKRVGRWEATPIESGHQGELIGDRDKLLASNRLSVVVKKRDPNPVETAGGFISAMQKCGQVVKAIPMSYNNYSEDER